MYRFLILSALVGLSLTACKPTPRTALAKQRPPQQTQQGASAPAPNTSPAEAAPAPAAPAAEEQHVAQSLVTISTTRQDYDRLRPWEKEASSDTELSGVYLGEGRVLSLGNAARAATYIEISLPDGSRSVPARVLRYDRDLNLALLTPVHAEDCSIFESRRALELGDPLKLGDAAAFDTLVRGLIPLRVALRADSSDVAEVSPMLEVPRMALRAAEALPGGSVYGLPVLREGKLVGIASGGNNSTQTLFCINAELIARFLNGPEGTQASCPMVGMEFTELNDPVFRRYLKLDEDQGGLYINEVHPGSAAEQAGLKVGDVVTAIDGLPLDTQGRVQHPLYGPLGARAVLRSHKGMGETMALSLSRDGEKQQLNIPLNRDALTQALVGHEDAPGVQPRYLMWGGLLFQPMTQDYLQALGKRAGNTLPVEFLELTEREDEFREKGVTELVMLAQVIPTPATLSYDGLAFCIVERVNGKTVHNFAEFVQLLDEPTPDGLVALSLNKAPGTIHVDRRVAEACNSVIRRNAIPQLRQLGDSAAEAAPADTPAPAEAEPTPADTPTEAPAAESAPETQA